MKTNKRPLFSYSRKAHIILPITAAVLVGAVGTLLWKSSNALDGLSQPCVAYNFSISDRAKYPQCVSMAQHLLIQNGNLTNTAANYNGDFGPVTQSAIIAFQKTHFDNRGVRLVASGWLNAPTWWSLCDVAYDAGRTGTGWAYQQAGCNKPANWEVAFRTNINIVTATVPAPASSSAPAPTKSSRGQTVVNVAKQHLNVPYVWGGTTLAGWDCSGLTQWVYKNAIGVSLPRSSGSQGALSGSAVYYINSNNPDGRGPLPGDLMWISGHVGIYAGGGNHVAARNASDDTKYGPISSSSFAGKTVKYIRVW